MRSNLLDNKVQIAQRFAQAQQSYDQHAWVQAQICQYLYQLIAENLTEKSLSSVLDIGCGSGKMSKLLKQKLNIDQLFLNDLYPEIKSHFLDLNHVQFLIGDIETIPLEMPLDLVVSSSALQWVENVEVVFQKIAQQLKPAHLFCFSTFGEQNLLEIKQLTGFGLDYLSLSELRQSLEKSGFEVVHLSENLEKMHFQHPKQVLQHLKATGVTATAKKFRWTKAKLNRFYQDYEMLSVKVDMSKQEYPLTYHPIYCVARRI